MPPYKKFASQAQARAAFGGYLGPQMKAEADAKAHATPGGIKSLPQHVKGSNASPLPSAPKRSTFRRGSKK